MCYKECVVREMRINNKNKMWPPSDWCTWPKHYLEWVCGWSIISLPRPSRSFMAISVDPDPNVWQFSLVPDPCMAISLDRGNYLMSCSRHVNLVSIQICAWQSVLIQTHYISLVPHPCSRPMRGNLVSIRTHEWQSVPIQTHICGTRSTTAWLLVSFQTHAW